MTIALPPPEDRSFADVWSALGGELKPSLDVVVSAPTDTGQRRETGPPVTAAAAGRPASGQDGWPPARSHAAARGPVGRQRAVVTAGGSAGLGHLLARISLVEDPASEPLVEHRRQDDPAPDDPFRGLYLTDEDVDRLLDQRAPGPSRDDAEIAAVEQACDEAERAGRPSRLRALQRCCALTDLDVELLLAALVPDLDSRFERLYGYLNDDVTRRRATIGLALEVGAARPRPRPPAPGSPRRRRCSITGW